MKYITTYKVVKEYDRFYLAKEIKTGTLECFQKSDYHPDDDLIIKKIIEDYQSFNKTYKKRKVNRKFNKGKYI